LTDHVDFTNVEHVLRNQLKIKGNIDWDILVLVGVELTHIPVSKIKKIARQARRLGAEIIIGHGETPVEPVEDGTNTAYVNCPDVDILAHPGALLVEDAETARDNGIFLELTSRQGHSKGNKMVAAAALMASADMIVDTDAHTPQNLITQEEAMVVARKAGLNRTEANKVVVANPKKLLKQLGYG
jgi:histidinol phosphatase-like PHP family hydrolase